MNAEIRGVGGVSTSSPSSLSLWPHRLAVLLACVTFPLLFIGGLVTSKGAGLAVPDWPTTFGYNMFLYPWSKMVGNIFYEHSHRLIASFVGLLTIALSVVFWLREPRRWLRWLALAALALVVFQGVLGGLRVVLREDWLAIVHAATAQFFFAITICLAIFTSDEWRSAPADRPLHDDGRLGRLCAITTGLIYLQIVFGAVVRHTGERIDAHLGLAALVALHIILIVVRVAKHHAASPRLSRPALFLFALLFVQLALGGLSYVGKFTTLLRLSSGGIVILTTTHLAVGALMLAAVLALTLRAYRYSMPALDPGSGREVLTEQFSV
jgi:heme a synthase